MKTKIYHPIVAIIIVCLFALSPVIAGQNQKAKVKSVAKEIKTELPKAPKPAEVNGTNKDCNIGEQENNGNDDHDKDKDCNKGNCKLKRCGTGILHLDIQERMLNEGGPSNATARVQTSYHSQGNATIQRVEVKACKLTTNTLYQLWVALGGDTNFVHAADFTTDARGNASLNYKSTVNTNTTNIITCLGKGALPLPEALDPVYAISALAIGNVNTQAVFTADLTSPDKFQYLIKRCFTNDTVSAAMNLQASTRCVKFCLGVSGLEGGTNYFLTVNNAPVSSGMSKTNGTLKFLSLPVAPADILSVTNIGVWDSSSNTVIYTTLPQDTFIDSSPTNEPIQTLRRRR